uniref:Uncharacterized protein n=1 Tax=Rhizophora mucronata TaxID=61149 RepID=A0A2P2NTI2_RHIMU
MLDLSKVCHPLASQRDVLICVPSFQLFWSGH